MRTYLDCIPCFARQALEATRRITDDEAILGRALRRSLRAAAEFDLSLTPAEMAQVIHRIIRQETGSDDPYREIKRLSTERGLELEKLVRQRIAHATDPFQTAVRFSIAGNIMDFALTSAWEKNGIEESLEKAETQPIDQETVARLEQELAEAERVLVLGDNAGETVFDRLLIEQFPGRAEVVYAVKHSPVINDATLEDARRAGLENVARLLSNGTDAPGTVLAQVCPEFLREFETADVVISKGQANFETLNTAEREVYFLTQIKCQVIARRYGYRLGDWLVTTTSAMAERDREEISDRS